MNNFRIYKNEKTITNFIFLIFILMFFTNIKMPIVGIITNILVVTMLFIGLILFFSCLQDSKINNHDVKFVLYSTLIVIFYMIGIVNDFSVNAFVTTTKITLLIFFCFAISKINFKDVKIYKFFNYIIYIYIMIYYGVVLKNGIISVTANNVGLVNMVVAYFCLYLYYKGKRKKINKIKTITCILLLLLLSSICKARSSLLSLVVSIGVLVIWNVISKNKFIYKLFFIIVILFIFLFIYFYTYADELPIFLKINELSSQYFNKNFFSGRNDIWKNLFEYIKLKPIFGYGSGAVNSNFSTYDGSTHNFYMQVLLHVGSLGMLAWTMFFSEIWNKFYCCKTDDIVKISASFFIGILFSNIFELTFYSNKIIIGIMQWMIIAIGLSVVNVKHNIGKAEE